MPKELTYCGGPCQKYTLSAGELERRRSQELQAKEERKGRKGKERETPREVFSFEYTNAMDLDLESNNVWGDDILDDDEESLPSTINEFTTERDGVMEYQIQLPGRDNRIIVHEDRVPGQRLMGRSHFERLLLHAENSGREMAQQFNARRNSSLPTTQAPSQSPPTQVPTQPSFVTAHASGSTNYAQQSQRVAVKSQQPDTICGRCGVSYMHMYSRGRRHLELLRPGEKPGRVRKWYNQSAYNKPGRMRSDDDGSTTGRDSD